MLNKKCFDLLINAMADNHSFPQLNKSQMTHLPVSN